VDRELRRIDAALVAVAARPDRDDSTLARLEEATAAVSRRIACLSERSAELRQTGAKTGG
jgi:hypothetical protein